MKQRPALTLFCLLLPGVLLSASISAEPVRLSGVNQITFHKPQYNKHFVGNGFLIRHRDKVYGVTVKHALLEAKTPEMNTVSVHEHIKQWQIRANNSDQTPIVLGELLNTDNTEKLDMAILSRDWLVFDVVKPGAFLEPITLRNTPIETGETLVAYGCTYADADTCQQNTYTGTFIEKDKHNLRIKLSTTDLSQLRGLSGSPVVDDEGQLVGIVSNVLPSRSGEGFDFAPASTDYLVSVLEELHKSVQSAY